MTNKIFTAIPLCMILAVSGCFSAPGGSESGSSFPFAPSASTQAPTPDTSKLDTGVYDETMSSLKTDFETLMKKTSDLILASASESPEVWEKDFTTAEKTLSETAELMASSTDNIPDDRLNSYAKIVESAKALSKAVTDFKPAVSEAKQGNTQAVNERIVSFTSAYTSAFEQWNSAWNQ